MKSKKLSYPGIVRGKALINLEGMVQAPVINYIFIKFGIGDVEKQKRSESIPKGAIVISPVFVRIEEAFNESAMVLLCLGTTSYKSLGFAHLEVSGVAEFRVNTANRFLKILENDEVLTYVITYSGTNAPTQGKGWCLLSYINTNVL